MKKDEAKIILVSYTDSNTYERMEWLMAQDGKGYLLVGTRTADGILLVPYADVKVYDDDGNIIFEGITDRDGYTEEIEVVTPPLANSLSPNMPKGYAEVSIFVEKEGYYDAEYLSVPIFPNVITIQKTNLQALPDAVPVPPYFDSVVNEGGANDQL